MDEKTIPSCSESTLTQRYQTTIPSSIRKALNLSKNDRIRYTIESENRVVISRIVEESQSDPVLKNFLNLLAQDMQDNPEHIRAVSSDMVKRAKFLVKDIDIDLDEALEDEEE